MTSLRTQLVATLALGAFASLAGLLAALALTDIHHGEPDVTLEWRIVQVAAVVIASFVILAMATVGRTLRRAGRDMDDAGRSVP